MSEPTFLESVSSMSTPELRRYLRRTATDHLTLVHKRACRDEIARRRTTT